MIIGQAVPEWDSWGQRSYAAGQVKELRMIKKTAALQIPSE